MRHGHTRTHTYGTDSSSVIPCFSGKALSLSQGVVAKSHRPILLAPLSYLQHIHLSALLPCLNFQSTCRDLESQIYAPVKSPALVNHWAVFLLCVFTLTAFQILCHSMLHKRKEKKKQGKKSSDPFPDILLRVELRTQALLQGG